MSGKDESIFSKEALMGTEAGRDIMKQAMLHSKGYKQFQNYKDRTEKEFPEFVKRFVTDLQKEMESDVNASVTLSLFAKEIGSEFMLEEVKIESIKRKLLDPNILGDRVKRILNSNFVKMTYPVFSALLDGADSYFDLHLDEEKKNNLLDGHIIAIDLSEPMDRIIDRDEDLEFLDDYKVMNPYILSIARKKISSLGEDVLKSFEEGFKDAREGQHMDYLIKQSPITISDEKMNTCYKKYRAVMGTAGKNMALTKRPLAEIFYHGMARAGESVGCGNEMEDSLKNGAIKVPSWPFYYAIHTGDVKLAFDLTLKRSELYLEDARIALAMLPDKFETKPFIEFLFNTVMHYNQFWYNQIKRSNIFEKFASNIKAT